MKTKLYEIKKDFGKHGISFCYSGPISKDLMNEITEIFEQKLKMENVNTTTVGKMFSLIVEQIENIMKYSDEKITDPVQNKELRVGIIIIGRCEDHIFYVMTGNKILNERVDRVFQKLSKIQHMNKDELKKYYKKMRRETPDKDSKGAGLGFIELARKVYKPIEFNFEKIDENYSFFTIKTKIKEKNNG